MTFDYGVKDRFAAMPQGAGAPTRSDTAATVVSTPNMQLLMAQFAQLPEAQQKLGLAQLGAVAPDQRQSQLASFLQSVQPVNETPTPAATQVPVGGDAMVQVAASQSSINTVGIIAQQRDNAQTTVTETNIAMAKAAGEQAAKQAMAAGRTDEQARAAAASAAGNMPELQQVATQAADGVTGADKFNLFSTRNQDQQNQPTASIPPIMETIAAVAAPTVLTRSNSAYAAFANTDNEFSRTGVQPAAAGQGLPWRDLGETTRAIAAMGQFVPQADLPTKGQVIGRQQNMLG